MTANGIRSLFLPGRQSSADKEEGRGGEINQGPEGMEGEVQIKIGGFDFHSLMKEVARSKREEKPCDLKGCSECLPICWVFFFFFSFRDEVGL